MWCMYMQWKYINKLDRMHIYVLIGGTTAVHDYIINTCIFKAFLIINLFRSFAIQCRVHWLWQNSTEVRANSPAYCAQWRQRAPISEAVPPRGGWTGVVCWCRRWPVGFCSDGAVRWRSSPGCPWSPALPVWGWTVYSQSVAASPQTRGEDSEPVPEPPLFS